MLHHPYAEKGQGLLEYALLLILIAAVVLVVLVVFGPQISNMYSTVSNLIPYP